jgi:tRNA(adenine34) deaminase
MDPKDMEFMAEALKEARKAFDEGEVPVGAVLVREGKIIARACNRREATMDPTAHAEVLALRAGVTDGWRLTDATLYVTKEPCIMCAGTMLNARLKKVMFGCRDTKGGAVESLYHLLSDPRLNHRVEVVSGVMEEESALLLKEFFRQRRGGRVVECGGLENRCGGDSTGGSNPPLSARKPK